MLLVRQREEAAQALFALNDVRTERLRDRITQWQFFFTDSFNFLPWSL